MSRYQLHEEIGRGAMGVVYRATQLELERVVALKLLGLDCMDDDAAMKRFHTEAQALSSLDHPHIVRVLDTGLYEGRPFMAMELLDGVDLQTLRDRRGAQPIDAVLSWLLQLTDALALIHDRGLIHRDVKPTNVFVSPSGHVTLMDFGLVKAPTAARLTEPGTVVGTPRYLAPEAVVGDPPGCPLDVFALALTAHEALLGTPWCPITDAEQVMHRILAGPLPDVSREVPGVPKWFAQAQAAALDPDPARRLTARQYLDVLRRNGVRASMPPQPLLAPIHSVTPLKVPAGPKTPPGYRLVSEIGAGAMGMVFRAVQLALSREVALKMMRTGLGATDTFRERFQREAHAMSKVSHPSLIKVFDVGMAGDQPYIAMELVPGRSLEAVITATPVEVRRRADALFDSIVEAVAVMHRQGLNHRDLKPGNVMVTPDWKPVVMDLGLVKDVAGDGTVLTRTGALLGTPAFLAPEVLAGGASTAAADVWALGCVYFHLSAGRPPFAHETLAGLYRAILDVALPDLGAVCADMPPAARAFMLRLLSKDPAARPADAGAVLEAFRAMRAETSLSRTRARGRSGHARPLSLSIERPRRRWATYATGAAVGVAVLGAAAFAVLGRQEPPPAVETPASVAPAAPRWRDVDAALRAFAAPQLLADLCAALERRRTKMKELRATEAALRTEWRERIQGLVAQTHLRELCAQAKRDPSLSQTDDLMIRYRLVDDLAALFAQLVDLGVVLDVDLAPLYPPLHRPLTWFPMLTLDDHGRNGRAIGKYEEEMRALLKGGETIGLRFTAGYGYIPTYAEENSIYYHRSDHAVHFWSSWDGGPNSSDIQDLGGFHEDRLSYTSPLSVPLRQVRQGERLLFDMCARGLGPTERLTFHLSRDGKSFSAPAWTMIGRSDEFALSYHHWLDPSVVDGPAFLRIDYHHRESVKATGNAELLWAVFHYVKQAGH